MVARPPAGFFLCPHCAAQRPSRAILQTSHHVRRRAEPLPLRQGYVRLLTSQLRRRETLSCGLRKGRVAPQWRSILHGRSRCPRQRAMARLLVAETPGHKSSRCSYLQSPASLSQRDHPVERRNVHASSSEREGHRRPHRDRPHHVSVPSRVRCGRGLQPRPGSFGSRDRASPDLQRAGPLDSDDLSFPLRSGRPDLPRDRQDHVVPDQPRTLRHLHRPLRLPELTRLGTSLSNADPRGCPRSRNPLSPGRRVASVSRDDGRSRPSRRGPSSSALRRTAPGHGGDHQPEHPPGVRRGAPGRTLRCASPSCTDLAAGRRTVRRSRRQPGGGRSRRLTRPPSSPPSRAGRGHRVDFDDVALEHGSPQRGPWLTTTHRSSSSTYPGRS